MVTEARFHLAYLMWCFQEGYVTPFDRAIVPNWLLEDITTLHPDDVVLRENLLVAADEVLAALNSKGTPGACPDKAPHPAHNWRGFATSDGSYMICPGIRE